MKIDIGNSQFLFDFNKDTVYLNEDEELDTWDATLVVGNIDKDRAG